MTAFADLHSDLLLDLAHAGPAAGEAGAGWLRLLEHGGVEVQVCAVNVASPSAAAGLEGAVGQAGEFHRLLREHPESTVHVRRRDDLAAAEAGRRVGLVLALEGAECLQTQPAALEVFWQLGLRMLSPTWYG